MFTLAHATLLIAGTFLAWWLWQVLGQRDYALALVRRHCERKAKQFNSRRLSRALLPKDGQRSKAME